MTERRIGSLAAAPVAGYDSIDSTNAEAARRAASGARGPIWILADEQTAGRGRSGRRWESPQTGNLYATLLFEPGAPATNELPPTQAVATLSYAAALAIYDAAAAFVPTEVLALKWPNDVLLNGRKLSGLLLESGGGRSDAPPDWLAIGFGVNLAARPDGAAALADVVNPPPSPAVFHQALAAATQRWIDVWREAGFAGLRAPWRARAARLGEAIVARAGTCSYAGVFEDVDHDGALLLREPEGALRRVSAADVHFPDAASPTAKNL